MNSCLPEGYNYRPLPRGLYIGDSDIEGQGLFTRIALDSGINLGVCHIKGANELIRTPLSGFVNHSITPNCIITDLGQLDKPYYYLVTLRDIVVGEELVVDYYKSACGKDIGFNK